MKDKIVILLISIFSLLTLLEHGTICLAQQHIGIKKQSVDSNSSMVIVGPSFLRPCIEELVKVALRKKMYNNLVFNYQSDTDSLEGQSVIHIVLEQELHVKCNLKDSKTTKGQQAATTPPRSDCIVLGSLGICLYTNSSNPLKGLTIPQIDAIFSEDKRCGFPFTIDYFSQLGLTGAWLDTPVAPFAKSPNRDLYTWVKKSCLCGGRFRADVKLLPTKADLFHAISTQQGALGLHLCGENVEGIKTIAISKKEGDDYVQASAQNITAKTYPLSARIIAYFDSKNLGAEGRKFLRFCISLEGQQILSSYNVFAAYPKGFKGKSLPLAKAITKVTP